MCCAFPVVPCQNPNPGVVLARRHHYTTAPMNTYTVEFHGVIVTVPSLDEAETLARRFANGSARQEAQTVARPRQQRGRETSGPRRDVLQWAEALLTAVRDAPSTGATVETVMTALRAKGGKAVGGRSAMVNNALRALGYQQHHVYDNARTAQGRFWKPRKQLPDALAAVQKALVSAA